MQEVRKILHCCFSQLILHGPSSLRKSQNKIHKINLTDVKEVRKILHSCFPQLILRRLSSLHQSQSKIHKMTITDAKILNVKFFNNASHYLLHVFAAPFSCLQHFLMVGRGILIILHDDRIGDKGHSKHSHPTVLGY